MTAFRSLGGAEPSAPSGRDLGIILGLALGVRMVPFLLAISTPDRFLTPDAVTQYLPLARDLSGGYLDPDARLFSTGLARTPVYPMFAALGLKAGGGSILPVVVAQIALGLVVVSSTFLLSFRLLGRPGALAASLLVSVDPASALYAVFFQPETLFTLLTLLSALAWLDALRSGSARSSLAAGALAGVAALTRPIGLFLPFVFAFTMLFLERPRRARLRPGAWSLAPFILIVGSWIGRNVMVAGAPVLSTIEGFNLLYYRAAAALAFDQGTSLQEAQRALRAEVERRAPDANAAARSRVQSALALQTLSEHPLGAMRSAASGLVAFTVGTGFTAWSQLRGDRRPGSIDTPLEFILLTAFAALLAFTYLAAGGGVLHLARAGLWFPLAFLLAFAGYFVLMSAGPEANSRFRVPAMPFLAILAGAGVDRLRAAMVRREKGRSPSP